MNADTEKQVSVIISSRFNAGSNVFNGVVTFSETMRNVTGYKITYFKILQNVVGPPYQNQTISNLFLLNSSSLSNDTSGNLYSIGTSLNSQFQNSDFKTSVIGVGTVNYDFTVTVEDFVSKINDKKQFIRPINIDKFDWFISPLVGSFSMLSNYNIEFVIDFYIDNCC